VTNKLGFKPRETMEDQVIKSQKGYGLLSKALMTVALGLAATVVLKSLTENKTVFEEARLFWGTTLERTSSLRGS
jgi:hypothetical protein